jgi:hypothetical protein
LTYERLLRKVLNKPRSPAVVLVQLPTVGQAFDDSNPKRGGFARTVEDVYSAFAAYYDTPYLSFRCVCLCARTARTHRHTHACTHVRIHAHTHRFAEDNEPGGQPRLRGATTDLSHGLGNSCVPCGPAR